MNGRRVTIVGANELALALSASVIGTPFAIGGSGLNVNAILHGYRRSSGLLQEVSLNALGAAFDVTDLAIETRDMLMGISGAAFSATNAMPVVAAPQATATYALSNYSSAAVEASAIIKNAPGSIFNLTVYNGNVGAQWIQLFNAVAVPIDTTVPVFVYRVPGGSSALIPFAPNFGKYFSTGICVSNSSTLATKTIGAADCFFVAEYK